MRKHQMQVHPWQVPLWGKWCRWCVAFPKLSLGVVVSRASHHQSADILALRSLDIGEFLDEEIRGPASFTCKSGSDCRFEEPAMNNLIDDVFGDAYITLRCDSGECLHYTQVPGYIQPKRPDNSVLVAISAAAAVVVFIIVTAGKSLQHLIHPDLPLSWCQ
jgi:hypothetical protein